MRGARKFSDRRASRAYKKEPQDVLVDTTINSYNFRIYLLYTETECPVELTSVSSGVTKAGVVLKFVIEKFLLILKAI